ncbi:MAG: hypothetical protein A2140_01025 [Candidatus Muproteobacteria bacterium RBG_16_62_13]|uniref:Uncharacterized protein n=1 Tax=Candidatus Muproteobacteria bacterium RBG_16_62_13 TaxID=1817756 RepID=A0A1F6T2R4_9PROT|nr:MAG: hypothetical protein A2140_01025 [Candidatus Muproteobacteria bacterium RBG_16_62_13]
MFAAIWKPSAAIGVVLVDGHDHGMKGRIQGTLPLKDNPTPLSAVALKEQGIWVFGATHDADQALYEADLDRTAGAGRRGQGTPALDPRGL